LLRYRKLRPAVRLTPLGPTLQELRGTHG
jgi:hypothetical protein